MKKKIQKSCRKISKGFMQLDEYYRVFLVMLYVHVKKSNDGFKDI